MNRNLLIIVLTIIVLGGGAFIFLNSNGSILNLGKNLEVSRENEMTGPPQEDKMVKELDEKTAMEMKTLLYQYSGELSDVTDGGKIRGITTNGQALGVAKSNYDGEQYLLLATFENLPNPQGDDFYEGWIVQKDPFMFLSTGIVKEIDGVYTNAYKSGEDLTNYNFYVLTIEPNDGDPAPADHIVEGTMQ